jgi:hypothetical protein
LKVKSFFFSFCSTSFISHVHSRKFLDFVLFYLLAFFFSNQVCFYFLSDKFMKNKIQIQKKCSQKKSNTNVSVIFVSKNKTRTQK